MFHMFDKLLLISEGYPVYYGKARESMEYFSSLRFVPEIPMNPAEFLLDLATGQINDIGVPEDFSVPRGSPDFEKAVVKVRSTFSSFRDCLNSFPSQFEYMFPYYISTYNSNTKLKWSLRKKKRIIEQQKHQKICKLLFKLRRIGHCVGGSSF